MSCGLVEIALGGQDWCWCHREFGLMRIFLFDCPLFAHYVCISSWMFSPTRQKRLDSYLMWWPRLWMLSSSFATHQMTAIPFLYVLYFKERERVFNFLQVKSKLYWIIQKSDKLVILMPNSWLKVDAWHCLSPRKFKVRLVKTEAFGH